MQRVNVIMYTKFSEFIEMSIYNQLFIIKTLFPILRW